MVFGSGHNISGSVLLFSKSNKTFLDTLIQKIFFQIIKINNFRGDLTDISAKKEALESTTGRIKNAC